MDLAALRAFLAVAEAGSISGAARATGIARSTLRRRIASLEAHLRTSLLDVDGTQVSLTARGRVLASRSRELLELATDIESSVIGTAGDVAERVSVVVSVGIHPVSATTVLQAVRAKHPDLALDVRFSVSPVEDMARDGDLAVVLAQHVPDGPWVARRVASLPLRLMAAPPYLAARGTPTRLEELAAHDLVHCTAVAPPDQLPTRDGGTVRIAARVASNDLHFCRTAAETGLGIALAPTPAVPGSAPPLGDPVVVLGDIVGVDLPVWLVAAGSLSRRPALAAIVHDLLGFTASMGVVGGA